MTPTSMPSGALPTKSAKMIDGAVFRCSRSPSAKSIVGQPHVHLPTTFTSAICERYALASGLPWANSHWSSFRSFSVSGRRSGRMKPDFFASGRSIPTESQVPLNAESESTSLPEHIKALSGKSKVPRRRDSLAMSHATHDVWALPRFDVCRQS
jgi:hypothetical protein